MKDTTLQALFRWTFWVDINLNDTFHYATADSESISADDLQDMEPIFDEFGFDAAIVAYVAILRGYDPTIPQVVTQEFKQAKAKILETMEKEDEYFLMELRRDRKL